MVKSYLTETESHFDDEVEMDRWMKMTEAEQEREVKAADREFSEFLDAMSPLESYRYWRRFVLTSIMENRRRLRNPALCQIDFVTQMWRDGIKNSQRSLLKHRHHFQTGVWPGQA
jgi:hypothetical protein